MDINRIIESLHPLEKKVVPFLTRFKTLKEIMSASGLSEAEAMRALQWLENKNVLKISSEVNEIIALDYNGRKYVENGLPERRFLKLLEERNLDLHDEGLIERFEKNEFAVCIGVLKKKAAISVDSGKISITDHGRAILSKEWLEEVFLKKVGQEKISVNDLKPEERFVYDVFSKRSHIVVNVLEKTKRLHLTELGENICKSKIEAKDSVERLTKEMLVSKSWKESVFRRYDVKSNVPKIYPGRKQNYRAFLDYVRRKFISLGFEEMFGPIVETDFWNMDALFMPQFHSARDIHDAYYVKEPKYGAVDEAVLGRVKQSHENGFGTGSRGWGYSFDAKRTRQLLLRTQGTACSARKLASSDLKIPGKYFAIAKCFRYDVVDASHLPDFFQTEGIVVEDGLNFTHLKGLLKMFAEEFAQTTSFKIKPAYFPFTEPSAELFAKHPEIGWIELAGSGIFRPEVTNPLGVDVPVIAWGIGIDRIGMVNMGINDIRELYSANINNLKKASFKY